MSPRIPLMERGSDGIGLGLFQNGFGKIHPRSSEVGFNFQGSLEMGNRLIHLPPLKQNFTEVVVTFEEAGLEFQRFLELRNCLFQIMELE